MASSPPSSSPALERLRTVHSELVALAHERQMEVEGLLTIIEEKDAEIATLGGPHEEQGW